MDLLSSAAGWMGGRLAAFNPSITRMLPAGYTEASYSASPVYMPLYWYASPEATASEALLVYLLLMTIMGVLWAEGRGTSAAALSRAVLSARGAAWSPPREIGRAHV